MEQQQSCFELHRKRKGGLLITSWRREQSPESAVQNSLLPQPSRSVFHQYGVHRMEEDLREGFLCQQEKNELCPVQAEHQGKFEDRDEEGEARGGYTDES